MEYSNGQESAEQLVRPPIIHDDWVPRARAAYEASKTSAEASKASADEAIIRYHDAARIILEAQAQRPLGDQLTQDEIARSMDISQTAVSKLLIWEKKYGALVAAGETAAIRSPWYQPPQAQLTPEKTLEKAQKKVAKKNAAVQAQEAFKQVQHGYESQLDTLVAEVAKLRANPPAPPIDDFVQPAPPPAAEPSGIDVNAALAASVAAWLRTQDPADVTELLENFCADVRRLLAP